PTSTSDLPPTSDEVQTLLDQALTAWIEEDADDGWRHFTERVRAAFRELTARLDPGRDAVVVTSGGVLAALCGHLLDAGPAGIVALNRVTVNCGLTTVALGRSGASLVAFNDHAHFSGAERALRTTR
ncbi:histidine phosphatase family protein, partial [Streptomyces durbertensis]